jgi:hypothetical protein
MDFCCFGVVFGCFVRESAALLLHVVNYPVFCACKIGSVRLWVRYTIMDL